MSISNERPPDSFEAPLRAAHALMRQRRGEDACRFLAQARDEALSSGLLDDAALFSSVRGSYLVAMGRDSEALEAYLEAERLSKGDAYSRLRTARHLVSGMKQPGEALKKVSTVLEAPPEGSAVRHEIHAIRGLAFLGLDQPEQAIEELQVLCSEASPPQLPSVSWDLTLVEEFLHRHLAPQLCQRYLELVESKAKKEGETRVLERALQLKSTLPAARTPSPSQES